MNELFISRTHLMQLLLLDQQALLDMQPGMEGVKPLVHFVDPLQGSADS